MIISIILVGVILVIGAGIAIGVRASARAARTGPVTTPQPTARRVVVLILLFALVVTAAVGLSGLLGRVLDSSTVIATNDVSSLARSLAFTLIAGPLAAVLWWAQWRRIGDDERGSVAWGLYVAGMSSVALITFSVSLLTAAALVVRGDGQPGLFATGIVWAGVWAWHRWMSGAAAQSPTRLVTVAPVIGSVFGLLLALGGSITALGSLLDAAVNVVTANTSFGEPWWYSTLQALVWCLGGVVIWWWHWFHDDARGLRGGLADVALVVVGIALAAGITLVGSATTLFVLLRLAVDRTDPINRVLEPLGVAAAAAGCGALVWAYHRGQSRLRSPSTRLAGVLVTSGVGLITAASGLGVIVNALLASLAPVFVGSDARTLLLGGISALVVGGPVWWLSWKPTAAVDPTEAGNTGRRLYLILVFGASAVVAIITLLVIGFRLFEFLLGDATGASIVDRVRAPFGLLVATGLVAAYHFAVWRRDRSTAPAKPDRRIGRVILVTGAEPEPLTRAIADLTGAPVTVWRRSAPAGSTESAESAVPDSATIDKLTAALTDLDASRVLIVTGPHGRLEVIALQD
ncbi:DUF5671 domain-containing protein [Cryobacterium sp. MLB-32]|uniref:DUF5671 domain-containing protein n=1 Tax=Cryobacterium sp. MLB-32 TaxID=1529318 RepID=UPI000A69D654|nr:DUF5671 domain-containing protein [Cryobacterium sp. MLB-32]